MAGGIKDQHKHSAFANIFNFFLTIAVALPAVYALNFIRTYCVALAPKATLSPDVLPSLQTFSTIFREITSSSSSSSALAVACDASLQWPFLAANIIYFFNVNVLFWIISLIQGSTWLIDPYWTIIPVMVGHFYAAHPRASFHPIRSTLSLTLIWIWSIRLTYSYFRREEWNFGAREDWRFTSYRKQFGKNWWWISIFVVYISQHIMLMGISLPLLAVHISSSPLNILDYLAVVLSLSGVLIAHFADTQLREYMVTNQQLKTLGKPRIPLLRTGIWRYSRHPNYFGEQLWWWGFALFAVRLGYTWMIIGPFINSVILFIVARMVESKMLKEADEVRKPRLIEYLRITSKFVPWPVQA